MTAIDVLVVGAGPAGASAAVWASRAGLDVMMIDRAAQGRDKCCGDGLTALALRELELLGLRPALVDSWMHVEAACVRSPQGRITRLPLPSGQGQFAAVCRRTQLDAALVDLASASGVEVRLGTAFAGFADTGDGASAATVCLSNGNCTKTRFVVAADGVYSAVRKALGIGPARYRGDWHAFRGYLRSSGTAARNMWVWFEPDLLPGYVWSFPLGDGRVNVGFGIPRRRSGSTNSTGTLVGSEIAATWAGLTERRHIAGVLGAHEPDGPVRAWPIPARFGELSLAQGRVLICGDAAAAADPLTGEGIGQAIGMGRMAANAIARGGPPHSVTARYEMSTRTEFALDHRLARGLSRVLAHERLAEFALGTVATTGWTKRQFARWMFEDYPRAALATPRRWNRAITNPRGAFAHGTTDVAVGPASSPS